MTQTAAHLLDHGIRHVLARQWVPSLPIPRRRPLAAQPKLVTPLLQVVHRAVTRPQDLFGDPHLPATGGLAPMDIPPDGSTTRHELHSRIALLPLAVYAEGLQLRRSPPALGAHGAALPAERGYSAGQTQQLLADGVPRGANRAERRPELNAGPDA